ncbi:AAA family ATPase [Deinococcus maricopensis]|uniref:Cytidyltransferase-related domain protein n=1 Tax=Deinococcus maricopensis (strain DSM 21211 / LMG 22137 / NRRL B-23946 / LB-34) TaxID=709986 RepID=E8U648_DEIML|nr:AAA family ATPase [Deinococcus maricopensis]ADV66537.1 cytidyltransferase-related domain protein [Deinococcus maricopensis DSM 21211]
MTGRYAHGLVIGKFAPLHRGHQLLIERALAVCDRVSVWVYARPDFPGMPSPVRRGWVRDLYPAHAFPHLQLLPDAANPPLDASPDDVHRAYVRRVLGDWGVQPDVVFTSEAYGEPLARELGCAHESVDPARRAVPISGTQLRADVHAHRAFLDPRVYAHFVRRVVLVGAESTGKSTLTRALAEALGTTWVREYGRDVYEREDGRLTPEHFLEIALGHRALEDESARAPGVHRWVIVDTNAATTLMWSYLLTRTALPELHALADACRERYAHTFLCAEDLPHEQDGWRANTSVRDVMQAFILQDLGTRGTPFTEVRGDVTARVAQAGRVLGAASARP